MLFNSLVKTPSIHKSNFHVYKITVESRLLSLQILPREVFKMKAEYLPPPSTLWKLGRNIRIFILHAVKWKQTTRNSVNGFLFCFVLFCEITCHINSVLYFCHMQWRTWQQICLLGLLSLGRGVVGSNIYVQQISTIKFVHHFCRFF